MGNDQSKSKQGEGQSHRGRATSLPSRRSTPPPEGGRSEATETQQQQSSRPAAAEPSAAALDARLIAHQEFAEYSFPASEAINGQHPLRFVFEIITNSLDSNQQRPPFELCLVLDVSGSMSGGKLDSLKQAVEALLSNLRDDDILHVVSYHSTPTVLASCGAGRSKTSVAEAVWSLVATGGTNISDALEAAAALLGASDPGDSDVAAMQKRIFLYTDGQPGEGKRSQEELSEVCRDLFEERHFHVSAFGIGTDVNGPLLEAMAEAGGGAYHFMTQRRIEELSKKALEDLSRVVATRGSLEVILALDARTTFPEQSSERTFVFSLGDIREGNKRRLPFCMEVSAAVGSSWLTQAAEQQESEGPWSVKVARLVFSCQPLNSPLHLHLQEEDVRITVPNAASLPVCASSPPRHRRQDPVVAVTFALADMSDRNERAVRLIGQRSDATLRAAIELLEEGLRRLNAVREFDDESFVETAIRRLERTLQRLQFRGLQEASRVALELQMQSNTFDRNSAAGFINSESGNHSCVGSPPTSPVGRHGASTPPMHRQMSRFGSSDDDDDTMDTPRIGSPSLFQYLPVNTALTMPMFPLHVSPPSPRPAPPPPQTLKPIEVSKALVEAAAARERGDGNASAYIPPEFYCSITQCLMDDPVMTSDGNTYQRSAIEKWLNDGNITSPLTGLGLCDLELRPNLALRSMMSNWSAPAVAAVPSKVL
jgi:Mg-chelatase subunit ChlD